MGRKRKMENYHAIFRASYHLFMAYGYDNVTVQDIERESKVHSRNFYRYFVNKDELLGMLIETIESQLMEYLRPHMTDDPLYTFLLFSIMKHEYAITNPDYFRLRAHLIIRPETFLKCFINMFSMAYNQNFDWKSNEQTMLQGLYLLGGTLMIQYGYINNISGNILWGESADFITNYERHEISESLSASYRRFMNYAIKNNLHVLGLPEEYINSMLKNAYSKLEKINIDKFRRFYEMNMGLIETPD